MHELPETVYTLPRVSAHIFKNLYKNKVASDVADFANVLLLSPEKASAAAPSENCLRVTIRVDTCCWAIVRL